MAEKKYVVTGHMAAFDTFTQDGLRRITFYRGQPVPADATSDAIEHNLSVNLIAEVPGDEPVGVDSAGAAVAGEERAGDTDSQPGEAFLSANTLGDAQAGQLGLTERNARVEPVRTVDTSAQSDSSDSKRAAAREKLPEDGSAPDGRASQAVWVEYMVAQGGSYDDLRSQSKADLIRLAEQRQQS